MKTFWRWEAHNKELFDRLTTNDFIINHPAVPIRVYWKIIEKTDSYFVINWDCAHPGNPPENRLAVCFINDL